MMHGYLGPGPRPGPGGPGAFPQPSLKQPLARGQQGMPQGAAMRGMALPPGAPMVMDHAAQLDHTVERNKNLRDAHMVDNWIRKSHQYIEKFKLDPLPDSLLQDSPSETGTDFSLALTSDNEQLHTRSPPLGSPPDSPPWRSKNEGGVASEMPLLPSQEIQKHLALLQQQQQEAEAQARRAEQEKQERQARLLWEKQQQQAEEKQRALQVQENRRHQRQLQEEQARQQKQIDKEKAEAKALADSEQNSQSVDKNDKTQLLATLSRSTSPTPESSPPVAVQKKQITLGVTFSKCDEGGKKVARIKEAGCAALHGGLKVGDLVLTIDGEDLTGKTAMQLNKLIVGDEGTQAILEVVKTGATDASTIVIERRLATSTGAFGTTGVSQQSPPSGSQRFGLASDGNGRAGVAPKMVNGKISLGSKYVL